jgi:ABC-type lipoprotein export system ATPase subunit/GNAT superfamily N-acetyltransferase
VKELIEVSVPLKVTPRVLQISGMFDCAIKERMGTEWHVDLPIEEKPWSVGLVVGPSGSGKSSLAKAFWPEASRPADEWSFDGSVVDNFPEGMPIRDVVGYLTAVGLGSPPAWIRPYRTLSTGEAFRASVARALAETSGLVVIDEFTSTVDRQVAKVASHAVQKAVRGADKQLIAVTCHYDVIDWLQPDWIYDTAAQQHAWRSVQPHPRIELEVHRTDRSIWPVFAPHHYLSKSIHRAAQCYAAFCEGQPVAFASYMHQPHWGTKNIKMAHRIVTLPDWQGLGIGMRLSEFVGDDLWSKGYRFRITSAHPAVKSYCVRSPRWGDTRTRVIRVQSSTNNTSLRRGSLDPRRFNTRTFQYSPPAVSP